MVDHGVEDSFECMECMDDGRIFCEYLLLPRMPKSFLMNGKRREETIVAQGHNSHEEEDISDEELPLKRPRHLSDTGSDDVSMRSYSLPTLFRPSAESAFSKIDRMENDELKLKTTTNLSPSSSNSHFPGLYPAFYSPMLSYPFMHQNKETGSEGNTRGTFPSSFQHPILQVPGSGEQSTVSPTSSPITDKNMFYYVDPRIPFTNYFLNLTKLLQKSSAVSSEASATTPLGKMAGEEKRAGDTETPYTPESQKSSPDKISSPDKAFSPSASQSGYELGEISSRNELRIDVQPDRMPIPSFLNAHHVPTSMTGNLLHHSHQHPAAMVPLHGTGLFHPGLMQLPGSAGFRRYNPEKPPPVKKYKCDVCGKAFSRSNTLVTHKRIHTGDKPFKCEICSRAFRQPGNLTRHRLTHTTVKPYECPTCHKAFNRASNLHTHMRTHTSFKSYICPYCGKGFHQKIDMKIHCYTHTAHTARLEAH